MIQTLTKSWWLLALCGVLNAMLALINVSMQDPDRSLRMFAPLGAAMLMCRLAVAAGVCTVAAGIWSVRERGSWFLMLNGLALGAYGLVPILWRGPLGFRPLFALLLVVMATSIAIFELASARARRRHVAGKWFFGVAGAASLAFALFFLALALRWINLEPGPHWGGFLLLGSYFGFSAICMAGLALRSQSPGGAPQSGPWETLQPVGSPRLAH